MVAHILLSQIDPDNPASLSPEVVTGLLREEMGYEGVVCTDDLTMGAISNTYGMGEAAVLAVEAGCDLLLVCHSADNLAAAHAALVDAVDSGRISMERLDESVYRVLPQGRLRPEQRAGGGAGHKGIERPDCGPRTLHRGRYIAVGEDRKQPRRIRPRELLRLPINPPSKAFGGRDSVKGNRQGSLSRRIKRHFETFSEFQNVQQPVEKTLLTG